MSDNLWEEYKKLKQSLASKEEERERLSTLLIEARMEIVNLRGAMSAQDDRERKAGEKCNVPYELHGCDWPDGVADVVIELRERTRKHRDTPNPTYRVQGIDGETLEVLILAKLEADQELYSLIEKEGK